MKFPSYPKYKDSGVEWLGEVPEHWEVKRGRFCMQVNPRTDKLRALGPDDEVSFVPMDAVGEYGGLRLDTTKPLADIGTGYTEFQNGDVIVAKITPCFENWKGALATNLFNGVAMGTTELHVLRALQYLDALFLFYLTLSNGYRKTGEAEMYGAGGQKRVPPEFNKNFCTPLPPLPEQHAIAAFLDAQTAKIDKLIAKKRELIDKLKEKRAALITRTVTRGLPPEAAKAAGLDPNPRMKDSGVEWLGEVPEHWEVNKFGRHIRWIEQGWSPQADAGAIEEGSWGVLKLSSVKAGSFNPDECKGLPDDVQAPPDLEVKVGDLLITRANTPDLVGDACVVDRTPALRMLCDLIYRVHVDHKRIVTYFAKYFLISKSGRSQIIMDARGTSGSMVKIAQGHIKGWSIPVPPLKEQRAISGYLDRETTKLDALTAKVESAIERLQEYRSALITAAVTGKIDVREATQ